jgi:hypothetical protein
MMNEAGTKYERRTLNYADNTTDVIVNVQNIDILDVDIIHKTIEMYDFAIVRGLFDRAVLRSVLDKLSTTFDPNKDNPPQGEARDAVRSNFQKFTAGGASLRYNKVPRFFRTFYNPVWDTDSFGMRNSFKTLIRLRNALYGIDKDFALDKIENAGLWSATRLHQYPQGGGFFAGHYDTILLNVAKEKNTNFYQLILTISEKGTDYFEGGAFVEKNDKRYLIEDLCKVGDVLVYDGRSLHGVEDIDADTKFNSQAINGRVVAMASLYST